MGGSLIVWVFLILAGVAALGFVAVPKGANQMSVPPLPPRQAERRARGNVADGSVGSLGVCLLA